HFLTTLSAEAQFAGYSVEKYMVESIVNPGAYIVSGYSGNMPATFGESMSIQDIADVLAYLHTFSTVDPYVAPTITEPAAEVTPSVEMTAEATPAVEAPVVEATPVVEVTAEATPES
ncbi:MAG TPA: hypothetical protein PLZ51_11235, partial [Aggregatilineales bacterium]|nr:hypothetical protein [Aggregatilineales bacterium]